MSSGIKLVQRGDQCDHDKHHLNKVKAELLAYASFFLSHTLYTHNTCPYDKVDSGINIHHHHAAQPSNSYNTTQEKLKMLAIFTAMVLLLLVAHVFIMVVFLLL